MANQVLQKHEFNNLQDGLYRGIIKSINEYGNVSDPSKKFKFTIRDSSNSNNKFVTTRFNPIYLNIGSTNKNHFNKILIIL